MGAKRVYAVEASETFDHLQKVVKENDMFKIIRVIKGRAEDIELSEKVDVIVSEWMGFYLLHESMLNSVIKARDKHLSEKGIILPSHAIIYCAPCTLESHFKQYEYWNNVYGFKMKSIKEYLISAETKKNQPNIIVVPKDELLSDPVVVKELDLKYCDEKEICSFTDRKFVSILKNDYVRGLCIWFECKFNPYNYQDLEPFQCQSIITGPGYPETHWKQTVVMMKNILVEEDEIFGWDLNFEQSKENERHYDISLSILDPVEEEHPSPCYCQSAKCVLINKLLENELNALNNCESI